MSVRAYLPSATFGAILGALIVSAGLVVGAEFIINPPKNPAAQLQAAPIASDWQNQFASSTAMAADSAIAAQAQMLASTSQTANLTDSIGRAILIQTSAAAGQGLGDSSYTQGQIVSQALGQVQSETQMPDAYTVNDLTTMADSPASLRIYGNALASAIATHPTATYNSAMIALGLAVDNSDGSTLKKLSSIAGEYRTLAKEVVRTPVPNALASLALQAANNYAHMADTCIDMQTVLSDPLKGLTSAETFASYNSKNIQVFTQIARAFGNNAILFNKSDPGAVWATFYSAAQSAAQAAAQAQAQSQAQTNSTTP